MHLVKIRDINTFKREREREERVCAGVGSVKPMVWREELDSEIQILYKFPDGVLKTKNKL